MGLCKCPRRNVTNLFCFEHRVNVCEHCLVENHAGCVVQSYLQWLTDSDFDSNCTLCEHALSEAQTVRLRCFHLFHWSCLNAWASRFPETTAPAGYQCPNCSECIFPPSNQVSRVLEQLRQLLETANWARAGLGLPILPQLDGVPTPFATLVTKKEDNSNNTNEVTHHPQRSNNYRASTPATALEIDDSVKFTSRKKAGDPRDTEPLLREERDADSDANKYKRRPTTEWLGGLLRAKYGRRCPSILARYSRRIGLLAIVIFSILLLLTFLNKVSTNPENDPLWDPMANPNIRVAAEESRGSHF